MNNDKLEQIIKSVATIQSDINSIKCDISVIKNDISAIKEGIAELKKDNSSMKETTTENKANISSMPDKIEKSVEKAKNTLILLGGAGVFTIICVLYDFTPKNTNTHSAVPVVTQTPVDASK